MGPVTVFYIAFASISLFACFLQLFISYKKSGDLIFIVGALLSLIIFLSFSAKFLCSTTIGNLFSSLDLLRCQLVFNQVVAICMLGVLFYLLKGQKKIVILFNVSILFLFIIFSLIVPDHILFGDNASVRSGTLLHGDSIQAIDKSITIWRIMIDLTILVFFISATFFVFKGKKFISFRTLVIVFTGLGLVLVTAFYDQIIDLNQINSTYLLPFALFTFYVILLFIPFSIFIKEVIKQQKIIQRDMRWQDMINEVNVIVVELNRMGHVEFINPYFFELTGYNEDEVIGKDWFEFFIPPKDYYNVQGTFLEVLESEFHPHYFNPILTKNKEEIMIRWFNVRTRNQDGNITGSLSIGVDVSKTFISP